MTFIDRVEYAMKVRGITRKELCVRTGLQSAHISDYKSHPDRSPRLATAFLIADVLEVSIDWLAGREGYTMDAEPADFVCPDDDAKSFCARYGALSMDKREVIKDMCSVQELKGSSVKR